MQSQQNPDTSSSKAESVTKQQQEVRCAVRFPLELPVVLSNGGGEYVAHTRNISASGALFELDHKLEPGLEIRFSLRMPGSILGLDQDVLVHCHGRVVRCSLSQQQYLAAATIDDYQFAEQ
jgi:PilZ domain